MYGSMSEQESCYRMRNRNFWKKILYRGKEGKEIGIAQKNDVTIQSKHCGRYFVEYNILKMRSIARTLR